MKWTLPILLGLVAQVAGADVTVNVTGRDDPTTPRSYEVRWTVGDNADSASIPNTCAVWRGSFYAATGGEARVYALRDSSLAAASGTLLATFTSSASSVTSYETGYPFLKVAVVAPSSGTAQLFLYCAREVGIPSPSLVKIAEHYPGADFSDQLEAAVAAAPAGGTVLITQSHTQTGTANITTSNVTIECQPHVTITQGGTAQTTLDISGERVTVRGCTFNGQKNSLAATWIKVEDGADYLTIEDNWSYDYRTRGIDIDPSSTGGPITGIVIQRNLIQNNVAATGTNPTGARVQVRNGATKTNIPGFRLLDNHIISRGEGNTSGDSDPFFAFVGTATDDVQIIGNVFDAEGKDATNRVTACMELAVANGAGITHPTDYMHGVVVANNTCITRDFVFEGMGVGMMVGAVYSNNVFDDRGTDTTYTGAYYQAEIGNMVEVVIAGNSFAANGRFRNMEIHDVSHATVSGNSFSYEQGPSSGQDEAIRIRDIHPSSGNQGITPTDHITITGNTFKAPATLDSGRNHFPIYLYCDGTAAAGGSITDIVIEGNSFFGRGAPGGGAVSGALGLQEVSTDGNCNIGAVTLSHNNIDNFDHVVWTATNHTYGGPISIMDNVISNLLTSFFLKNTGVTLTGAVRVKGQGTDAPVLGADSADGSVWIDTNGGAAGNCLAPTAGDICTSAGGAWTIH